MRRGDIFATNLDPTVGHEQAGHRPVIIVSRTDFNQSGVVLVCPITLGGQSSRLAGFTVALTASGTETQGLVLCHQIRALDLRARKARKIETAPYFIVDEVLARIQAILN